jgi:hypothetical protein
MSEHQDFSNQSDDSLDITATAVPPTKERASETDADVELEPLIDSDSEEMEWVEETSEAMYDACNQMDWNTFEKFLSDKVHLNWKVVY